MGLSFLEQFSRVIALREVLNFRNLMLPDSYAQVIRDATLERAGGAGHDVYPVFVIFSAFSLKLPDAA